MSEAQHLVQACKQAAKGSILCSLHFLALCTSARINQLLEDKTKSMDYMFTKI